jgi:putative intracellular protease/amidase
MAGKILVVSTGASKIEPIETGLWLEELAAPYYTWKSEGYEVAIATASPGKIPLDPASLQKDVLTQHSKSF